MADRPERHSDGPNNMERSNRASLRFILMFVVNLGVILSVGSLLVFDYQREINEQLQAKRLALRDEAKTLRPAVEELEHHGEVKIQQYIDQVCALMQTASSPGHHIMARVGEHVLQASFHRQETNESMRALMELADDGSGIGVIQDRPIIVGRSAMDEISLYVSEQSALVYASARKHFFGRALYVLLFAFIGIGLINFLLVRLVTLPVDRMVAAVRCLGSGDLHARSERFRAAEFDYLSTEFNRMAQHLESANREREAQLHKARQIQANLMPDRPEIPGLALSIVYEPATEVGGDFYDVLERPDGRWVIALGDVSGHGVPAALGAAMLKTLLNEACREAMAPSEILLRLNNGFRHVTLPGDFATMLLACWDPRDRSLRYASAGHEPGYLFCKGEGGGAVEMTTLSSTGIILGIDSEPSWTEEEHQLGPDDLLLFCTDGVVEVFNAAGHQFGRSRLLESVSECFRSGPKTPAEKIASVIQRDVRRYRGEADVLDDLTLFVARVRS